MASHSEEKSLTSKAEEWMATEFRQMKQRLEEMDKNDCLAIVLQLQKDDHKSDDGDNLFYYQNFARLLTLLKTCAPNEKAKEEIKKLIDTLQQTTAKSMGAKILTKKRKLDRKPRVHKYEYHFYSHQLEMSSRYPDDRLIILPRAFAHPVRKIKCVGILVCWPLMTSEGIMFDLNKRSEYHAVDEKTGEATVRRPREELLIASSRVRVYAFTDDKDWNAFPIFVDLDMGNVVMMTSLKDEKGDNTQYVRLQAKM